MSNFPTSVAVELDAAPITTASAADAAPAPARDGDAASSIASRSDSGSGLPNARKLASGPSADALDATPGAASAAAALRSGHLSSPARLSSLDTLESEAIHIIREVVAEFEKPALLFSGGKDSVVMLHLATKAFWPGKVPFPVLHVDTGHNFPEVIDFRDRTVERLGLKLVVGSVQEFIDSGELAERADGTRNPLQTVPLLDAIQRNKFDAVFGGGRRDEDKARAKERILSLRDEFGQPVFVEPPDRFAVDEGGRRAGTEAQAIDGLERYRAVCGGLVEGDAEQLLQADLSDVGLTQKRQETIRNFSRAIASGQIILDRQMDAEKLIKQLCALPGIGEWTANYIVMRGLSDPDAFPFADLGLMKALNCQKPKEVKEIAEAWRPWRAYAAVLLWQSLGSASKET